MTRTSISVNSAVAKKSVTQSKDLREDKLLSKQTCILLNDLDKEHKDFSYHKMRFYHTVYALEQAFEKEFKNSSEVRIKYPTFEKFICSKITDFDTLEYLGVKLLLVSDQEKILNRITNSALEMLRRKVVKKNGWIHPQIKEIIKALPNKSVIDIVDIHNVFSQFSITKKTKSVGKPGAPRLEPKYTKKELNDLTKNDLIVLCIKIQAKWIEANNKTLKTKKVISKKAK